MAMLQSYVNDLLAVRQIRESAIFLGWIQRDNEVTRQRVPSRTAIDCFDRSRSTRFR